MKKNNFVLMFCVIELCGYVYICNKIIFSFNGLRDRTLWICVYFQ